MTEIIICFSCLRILIPKNFLSVSKEFMMDIIK